MVQLAAIHKHGEHIASNNNNKAEQFSTLWADNNTINCYLVAKSIVKLLLNTEKGKRVEKLVDKNWRMYL